MDFLFRTISRFVAMAGIGGIAQSVATDLLARLADQELTDKEFKSLQNDAQKRGYTLDRV
ncbi:hypothetical protein [Nodosilinea sp. E11]|uniref:hypothetical protein n=1 Tax=Nodosilinea sp. E11 TaxID=3037479 RepID=UPI0029349A3C|nr:hypothetical protein [Nodosilinea sp. E11]WOD37329.1 hypothetical protein RRF56_02400 [Nodosilinea sp. E11]